jgi:hypothetical protein
MKAFVELVCWIDTGDKIVRGELDRLCLTIANYLRAIKGDPHIEAVLDDPEYLRIEVFAGEGKPRKDIDAFVLAEMTEALTEQDLLA